MDTRMIVVGVDDSPESRMALRWALDEAMRTGARVEATTAWDRASASAPAHPARDLHSAVTRARAEVPGAPDVAEVTIVGDPSTVLLATSRQADLLVVGMREHRPCVAWRRTACDMRRARS
jgi:nucleotide-binding universal stress UspA family protein